MTNQYTTTRNHQKTNNLLKTKNYLAMLLLLTPIMALSPTIKANAEPIEQNIDVEEEDTDNNLSFGEGGYKTWYLQSGAATTLDNNEPDPQRFGFIGVGISEFLFNRHSIKF